MSFSQIIEDSLKKKTGVQLFYIVVLVSSVQQSESAICIHISPVSWTAFAFRPPHCIKQSSLCYTIGSCQLSILYIVSIVYVLISISQFLQPYPFPPLYPYICSLPLCLYFLSHSNWSHIFTSLFIGRMDSTICTELTTAQMKTNQKKE